MNNAPGILDHEEAFVRTFVIKERRERSLFELREKRHHFLGRFCHNAATYLDSRLV